jgi:DNA-directed RNA polymerase subunit beta
MARDTKLGPEEITRDIPNVGEEALKQPRRSRHRLYRRRSQPGDILVGKITPKGESPMTPEEKLLRAIFGEKASDVRDTSLRCRRASPGTVVEVRVFNRHGVDKDERALAIEREEIERLPRTATTSMAILDRNIYGASRTAGRQEAVGAEGLQEGTEDHDEGAGELSRSPVVADRRRRRARLMAEIEALRKQYDEPKKRLEQRFETRSRSCSAATNCRRA